MKLNVYFKHVDTSKGYVACSTPLSYTSVKKDAFKVSIDFESIDADVIESELWNHLDTMIDQSGSMDWILHIENDEEELYAIVRTDATSIAVGIQEACSMAIGRGIRECCTMLSDYLMSKALEMSVKSIAEKIAPSDTQIQGLQCLRPQHRPKTLTSL